MNETLFNTGNSFKIKVSKSPKVEVIVEKKNKDKSAIKLS